MSSEAPKRPRLSVNLLRKNLLCSEVTEQVRLHWLECEKRSTPGVVLLDGINVNIIQYPFPVCVISDFIENTDLLSSVITEAHSVQFVEKDNDLYRFTQTDDVKNLSSCPNIKQLYDVLCTEFHSWLSQVFNNTLFFKDIAATFSSYKYKDRLLCHDDQCEKRHIAFVLYLTPNWSSEDGGLLELFSSDEKCYPLNVVHSLVPTFNTMVLFEVTPTSFHQVSEVLSRSKDRLSLNGWFHSERKAEGIESCALELPGCQENSVEVNLEDYFLFNYLVFQNQLDIKSMFVNDSEIQLEEFLIPDFWESVCMAWLSDSIKWIHSGPPNIRSYETADPLSLPAPLKTLKELLESKCWFKYLKTITGLDLAPSASSDPVVWYQGRLPQCHVELRRWTRGCYTLIHDNDPEFHVKALDAFIRFPYGTHAVENGSTAVSDDDAPEPGHVVYIDSESRADECLLHIGYKMNSLALIFRDTKTLRFTKYLDCTAQPFFEVSCSYRPWNPPEDQPNLRHCMDDSDSEPGDDFGVHEEEEEEDEEEESS